MTFVGKILVVLQLILCVCFMGFAAAVFTVHDSWKQNSKELQVTVDTAKKDYAALDEEYKQYKDDLAGQIKDQTDRADSLRNDNQFLDQRNKNLKTELDTTKTERDTQRALATIAGDEAKIRRDEAIKQRVVNTELHKAYNDLNTQVRVFRDDLFNKQVASKQVAERYNKLLEQLAFLKRVIAAHGLDTDPNAYVGKEGPVEDVVGVVLETTNNNRSGAQLIKVSIGSDDGLAKGNNLFVYRTGLDNGKRPKYLGMIEIVYVKTDEAVGKVIKRAKNGVIEISDNVSTKL